MDQPAPPYWPPAPPPVIVHQKTSALTIVLLVVFLLLVGLCVITGFIVANATSVAGRLPGATELQESFVTGDRSARDRCVIVPISGIIMEGEALGLGGLSEDVVGLTRRRLEHAADIKARALILEINSPGGGVTASDLIHRMITDFRRKHDVPIVALMKDVAASGGYYVAAPADWIVAAPSTITASIGVIMAHYNLKGLSEGKLGITYDPVLSAPQKDILSPFRDMRSDERQHLQAIVDQMYDRFVQIVVDGRKGKVTTEGVRALQSTVLTGVQALEAHLVDALGTMDEAVAKAKELASVSELRVIRHDRPPGLFEQMLRVVAPSRPMGEADLLGRLMGQPPLLYLWSPGF